MKRLIAGILGLVLMLAPLAGFARDVCDACGLAIEGTIYTWDDRISQLKKRLCTTCSDLSTVCYLCGVPAFRNYQALSDGRTICDRDVRNAILDDEVAAKLCAEVKDTLDRQFSRFLSFPTTNVAVALMDRVRIQEIYKFAGNDFACPNMWGCTEIRTNELGGRDFSVSLLSGLPRDLLQVTAAHEYTHTWLLENLPARRAATIGKDAIEGFCELIAYLYAREQGLESARTNILGNYYTRGQIHLLVEAERGFGFNEVVEWMKFGVDPLLRSNDVSRVREVHPPERTKPAIALTATIPVVAARTFDSFVLQGVTWSTKRPIAMINGRNFEIGDTGKVLLAGTNVSIRCISITESTVVIQPTGSTSTQTLRLKP